MIRLIKNLKFYNVNIDEINKAMGKINHYIIPDLQLLHVKKGKLKEELIKIKNIYK